MALSCPVVAIASVEAFGDNLSVITTSHGEVVIANRKQDGSFRTQPGARAAYIPVNAILPQDVAEARGYWEPGAKKGMLGGAKKNRVTPRMFGPEDDRRESRGLLFYLEPAGEGAPEGVEAIATAPGKRDLGVQLGDDLATYFGVTEYVPE